MTTTLTLDAAEQQLRSLEAEQAGLDDQARRALGAGDVALLSATRRRREEIGDELALAQMQVSRLRIEDLQGQLRQAQAALNDPDTRAAAARAQEAVPIAQQALYDARQAAVASLVALQGAQSRVDALAAALAREQAALRARTALPPAPTVPQPATRLVYGGPGHRPDTNFPAPPPVPATA